MNKALVAILLTLITIQAGIYHYTNTEVEYFENNVQSHVINSRNFFKNNNDQDGLLSAGSLNSPVLTYGIRYTSDLDQLANDSTDQSSCNNIQITAQAYVQGNYIEADNILEVAVQYTSIDKNVVGKTDDIVLVEEDEEHQEKLLKQSNGQEKLIPEFYGETEQIEYTQRQFPMYVLHVDMDSGKIISVMREFGYDQDKSIEWITQQFISDIFPDCRKSVYEQAQLEQDNLGTVEVDYIAKDFDENTQILIREYDQHDLVQPHVENISHPDFDYDRSVVIEKDTGVVLNGESVFIISLGKEMALQADEEGNGSEDFYASGEIKGNVKQEFWKINSLSADSDIANAIIDYKMKAVFAYTQLVSEIKSAVAMGNGQPEDFTIVDIDESDYMNVDSETQKQQEQVQEEVQQQQFNLSQATDDGRNIYRENNLASMKIFGSHLRALLIFSGTPDQNYVHLDINVNSHLIKRIVDISFNNCTTQAKNFENQDQDITLFEAYFPVFGIITIKVSAKAKIQFGYDFSTNGANGQCDLNFRPWVKTALYVEGKASIAEIISAGIYGQGNFIDANLVLYGQVTPNRVYTSLNGEFRAFSIEVGLTYSMFQCSLKNVTGRRMLESLNNNNRRELRFGGKIGKVVHKTVSAPVHVVTQTANAATHVVEQTVQETTKATVNVVQQTVHATEAVVTGTVDLTGQVVEQTVNTAVGTTQMVVDGTVHVVTGVGKISKNIVNEAGNVVEHVYNAVEQVAEKAVNQVIEITVNQVEQIVSEITQVVEEAIQIAENITKICQVKKGYKQLHKSSSPTKSLNLFEYELTY